jgi:uncharacterized membrane protein
MDASESSTGLASHVAAPLAYIGWWATGLIFWLAERRDPYVRFHAAQALTAFGGIALLLGVLGALALASLSFLPFAFDGLVVAAEAIAALAVLLWIASVWQVARGGSWRIPLAARWADRMSRTQHGPALPPAHDQINDPPLRIFER